MGAGNFSRATWVFAAERIYAGMDVSRDAIAVAVLRPGEDVPAVERDRQRGLRPGPLAVYFLKWRGAEREREFPMGPFYDSFTAGDHEGLLLLHSPGNTFFRDLGDQESILVQPSSLVYLDDTVALALHLEHPRTLGLPNPKDRQNYRLVWLRLTGPGRVAVQSVYELAESAGRLDHFSFASTRIW